MGRKSSRRRRRRRVPDKRKRIPKRRPGNERTEQGGREPACDIRDTPLALLLSPMIPLKANEREREREREREGEIESSRASWCTPLLLLLLPPSPLNPFPSLLAHEEDGRVLLLAVTCRIVDFSQTGQKDSPGKGRTLAPQQRPSRRARVRARVSSAS